MKIEFIVTDRLAKELEQMSQLTGETIPVIFNRGFTLLRLHVEAHQNGKEIIQYVPEDVEISNGYFEQILLPVVLKEQNES